MRRAGRVPSSRVLTRVIRPSTPPRRASLGIPAGQPVVHLRRLRLADGEPIALESTSSIGATARRRDDRRLADGSLHETLGAGRHRAPPRDRHDRRRPRRRPRTPACSTSGSGDPLLVERRVIADGHGRRIEATESRYPADRYGLDVQFDVEGPDPDGAGADRRRPMTADGDDSVSGRLVLDDRVAPAGSRSRTGWIAAVDLDDGDAARRRAATSPRASSTSTSTAGAATTRWAIAAALDGMARPLLRRGVTSFLPTAVTAPLDELAAFAERVRGWLPDAPADGAEPLGFNLEGPFLAAARRGAHDPAQLLVPADVPRATPRAAPRRAAPDDDRARAARRDRAHRLAPRARRRGLDRALGGDARARHGPATRPGATSTTHLFNAMSGLDHRAPGRRGRGAARRRRLRRADRRRHPRPSGAVAAHRPAQAVRPAAARQRRRRARRHGRRPRPDRRPRGRGRRRARAPSPGRRRWPGRSSPSTPRSGTWSRAGVPLPAAVAAASRNPLALLGITDRGRIAPGQRADLVELDDRARGPAGDARRTWFEADRWPRPLTPDAPAAQRARHRRERALDVVEHPHRRLGHDLEVALAELGGRLARVAPRARVRGPVDRARRREEERGVDRRPGW